MQVLVFFYICTNIIFKWLPKYFLDICTVWTFQRGVFKGPLTGSLTVLIYTGKEEQQHAPSILQFLSPVVGGQKQKYEDTGSQEGNPWQPDIKMVQESSRTSQVAPRQTQEEEKEEQVNRSFLKANGLSMLLL